MNFLLVYSDIFKGQKQLCLQCVKRYLLYTYSLNWLMLSKFVVLYLWLFSI